MSEERIADLLAPLASARTELPTAEAVYLRARIQQVLDTERQRRAEILRPLRLLHRLLGVSSIAAAVAIVVFSPAIGVLAVPSSAAAAALGAALLSQTARGILS